MKRVKPGSGSGEDFLLRRTWINPVTDIKAIVKEKPFVVMGGVATRLYMPERMTLDLDILVQVEDAPLIYKELEEAGSRRRGELSIPGSQWQLADGTELDIVESDEIWAKEAIAKPNYSPDGLPIISLPYLVLMKLKSSRSQDLADVSRMMGAAQEQDLQAVKMVIEQYLPTACEDLASLIVLGKLELGK
ncbi:MAG: hypothetical protein GDA44_14145 [Prochloron sp. SP5CPC1]|nr:hypothetical protein [Candidatus Paraprochloron terpiosi SP5CPC1]